MARVTSNPTLYFSICLTCISISLAIPERACEVHYGPGTVLLGGLFPAYYTEVSPCDGQLWGTYISMIESMTYTIHRINQRDDLLRNITLGYEIRNTCNDEDISLWSMITMTSPSGNVDYQHMCPLYNRGHTSHVFGVIGPPTSTASLFVAKASSIYEVPMISYFATSDELSNKDRFPYFLRSVPPDKFQVGAIIDLLVYFNWRYIALFYSVDSYGVSGARQLRSMAQSMDICITINLPVPSLPSTTDLQDVVDKLRENVKINVIVIFALRRPANTVLRAVKEYDLGRKFTFIGSDGWGEPIDLALGEYNNVANGGLFVRPYSQSETDVMGYFKDLPNTPDITSDWYRAFLHGIIEHNNCSNSSWTLCPIPYPEYETLVINAVYAFAYALDESIRNNCNGETICDDALKGSEILNALFNVSFKRGNDTFKFDKNGDPSGKYVIQNHQYVHGKYILKKVGIWDPEGPIDSRLSIDAKSIVWGENVNKAPQSLCIEDCRPGFFAVPLKKRCCWGCQRCQDHFIVVNDSQCIECPKTHWPDDAFTNCVSINPEHINFSEPIVILILSLSVLGIVVSLFAAIGIWYHRSHPLIKSTSRELSSVNIIGLTISCFAAILVTQTPTSVLCILCELSISICFTLTFAPIVLKVNRIWRIFHAGRKSVKRPRFVGPRQQLVLMAILIFAQVNEIAKVVYDQA